MRTLLIFPSLLLSACFAAVSPPGTNPPEVARRSIEATEGRSCTAWLVTRDAAVRDTPVVLSLQGTGEYTMAESWKRDPTAGAVLEAGAAWLVVDKPGIVADPQAPQGFRIEDREYDRYTLDDLEACAVGALGWASSMVGSSAPIVIRGHSEGAIAGGEVLLRLNEAKDPLGARIAALLLSGAPVGPMREVFDRQVKASGRAADYERALAAGDDGWVREHAGVGATTLRALLEARALRETFVELAKYRPATRIAFFHGLQDRNAPVEMLQALVAENEARSSHAEPALELAARYYDAGHSLDLAAVHDINLWLLDAIRRQGYLETAERDAAAPVAIDLAEESIAAIVGSYRIDEGMTLEITREGTRFFARASGQPAFPIYFTSADRLETRVAPIQLELERDGKQVPAVVLIQGSRIRCPRID